MKRVPLEVGQEAIRRLECGSLLPLSPRPAARWLYTGVPSFGECGREQARCAQAAASCRTPERARRLIPLVVSLAALVSTASAQSALSDYPQGRPSAGTVFPGDSQPAATNAGSVTSADRGWPRTITSGAEEISVYQPQLEKWEGNELAAYAAVSVKTEGKEQLRYGVVWFTARTEVDKVNREVTLDNFQIAKVRFPTAENQEAEYEKILQQKVPSESRSIALDRLMAGLAAAETAEQAILGVPVKNVPPTVIVTTEPAILVLIDGPPHFTDVSGTKLQRVINTPALVVLEPEKHKYYLSVMDGWMEAAELEGPWSYAKKVPGDLEKVQKSLQQRQQVDTLETGKQQSLKNVAKYGKIPAIHVNFGPAELLEIDGQPQFEPITGTGLEYVKNTTAEVFRDTTNLDYYVLLSGRWFKSRSLENGPWSYVDGKELPAGFAKIPEDSPMAGVLVSVPGTPQAKEALIANAIPQTATITRKEAKLQVRYDGAPEFKPIEGMGLQYAVNTSTPVIRVDDKNYYAVENGVWFVGAGPAGPWTVATSVPAVIYTIPPSSSLHYVTYVKVYGSTPDVVYVGYTPGYYGTAVSSSTQTVVYGTGWYYPPYIGSYWYGAPYTYGAGVGYTWSSGSGWSIGFGVGYAYGYPYYYPWWGPWGWYGPCCWAPAWGWGWGGYASTNVYGRWGNTAYARTQAAWANPYTGNYGAGSRTAFYNQQRGTVGVGGRGSNTNIYTGNTVGGRGGIVYDPKTGIVAGGGAGYAGNIYTGQGTAGRGGFVYNTETGAGVAGGKNNVYAGKDGTVYRYDRQDGSWSKNTGGGWEPTQKPAPELQQQQRARTTGQQRTDNFSRSTGSFRGGGGMRMGGGFRRR